MRSMKNFLPFATGVFVIVLAGNCLVYSDSVRYNSIVTFKSKKLYDKFIWAHALSRDINNNQTLDVGDSNKGRSANRPIYVPEPDNHHELLIGTGSPTDIRDKTGNQFFVIQSVDGKTGAIQYGDKIRILAFFSGPGIASEAGLQEKSRIWCVHDPARLVPDYCEIVLSVPAWSEAQTSKAYFTFVGSTKSDGTPVDDGDILYIKSLSGEPHSDGICLFALPDSRLGGWHGELVLHRGDERELEHGKFEIQTVQKDGLIPEGKVAYDRTTGVLKQIIAQAKPEFEEKKTIKAKEKIEVKEEEKEEPKEAKKKDLPKPVKKSKKLKPVEKKKVSTRPEEKKKMPMARTHGRDTHGF